jgi:hypothetical protein
MNHNFIPANATHTYVQYILFNMLAGELKIKLEYI